MGNKFKNILTFLVVMLVLFMLIGMYYGALIFFSVLKIMIVAVVIGWFIRLYFKIRNR